jgi:hypothetical protein
MSLRSRSSVVRGIPACLSATRMAAGVGAQCRAEISEQLPAGPDAHSRGRVGRGVVQLVDRNPCAPQPSGIPALITPGIMLDRHRRCRGHAGQ